MRRIIINCNYSTTERTLLRIWHSHPVSLFPSTTRPRIKPPEVKSPDHWSPSTSNRDSADCQQLRFASWLVSCVEGLAWFPSGCVHAEMQLSENLRLHIGFHCRDAIGRL
jgi:hypothetical protein